MATLGFKTKWPKEMGGGDTDFIFKIWSGLVNNHILPETQRRNYLSGYAGKFGVDWSLSTNYTPKIHTIRHDPHNLWKPGRKIHPVVFNRTKNRFQFAPVLECKSVQEIEIEYLYTAQGLYEPYVKIDNKYLDKVHFRNLAKNDGFKSIEQFFQWFNTDTKPDTKIIHWTDNVKYQKDKQN